MRFYLFVFLMFGFILLSCAHKAKEKDKQVIVLPDHVEIYNPFLGENLANPFFNKSKRRIYTLIDASCASCLSKLQKWNIFQLGIKEGSDVSLIPICYTKDNFEILKYYFENDSASRLNVPLVLDLDNKFVKLNAALISSAGEMTVLTDDDNVVLLKGNPIEYSRDKEDFLKMISQVK